MIGALARKLFGSANERRIRSYQPRVDAIEQEPAVAAGNGAGAGTGHEALAVVREEWDPQTHDLHPPGGGIRKGHRKAGKVMPPVRRDPSEARGALSGFAQVDGRRRAYWCQGITPPELDQFAAGRHRSAMTNDEIPNDEEKG